MAGCALLNTKTGVCSDQPLRQVIEQKRLIRRGLCRRCGAKRRKSKVYCDSCKLKVNAEAMARYYRRVGVAD